MATTTKLSPKEAAAHYGVDVQTIWKWTKRWIAEPGRAPRGVVVQQPGGKRGRISIMIPIQPSINGYRD